MACYGHAHGVSTEECIYGAARGVARCVPHAVRILALTVNAARVREREGPFTAGTGPALLPPVTRLVLPMRLGGLGRSTLLEDAAEVAFQQICVGPGWCFQGRRASVMTRG